MKYTGVTSRLARATNVPPWLLLGAALATVVILYFYVQTLSESVRRGESMRQAWRLAGTAATAPRTDVQGPAQYRDQRVAAAP